MWRSRRVHNGQQIAPTSKRATARKVASFLKWEWLGDGGFKTADGILDPDYDSEATAKQVAVRAYRDVMWREESRAVDTKGQEYHQHELYLLAHVHTYRLDIALACCAHGPSIASELNVPEETIKCPCG